MVAEHWLSLCHCDLCRLPSVLSDAVVRCILTSRLRRKSVSSLCHCHAVSLMSLFDTRQGQIQHTRDLLTALCPGLPG